MSDYRLRIGTKFRQQGRLYVIEQALPNDYLGIKDILSGEIRTITRGELLVGLFDGELELVGDPDQNGAKGDRLADLSVLDLNLHAEDDPLERVECDHTMLDLMIVDTETRLTLGRPRLTAMLDTYSRIVHGSHISFYHPSYLSLMQSLRHVNNPKDYVRNHYPEIKNDWPAYGLPELLVVDNGTDARIET
jgi:hypothetical protein